MIDQLQDKITDEVCTLPCCTHQNYVSTADITDMRHTCCTCGAVRDVRVVDNAVVEGPWSVKGAHPSLAVYAIAQACRAGQRVSLQHWTDADRDHLMRVCQSMYVQGEIVVFVHKAWSVALRIIA
jgi:hypothetical protein